MVELAEAGIEADLRRWPASFEESRLWRVLLTLKEMGEGWHRRRTQQRQQWLTVDG
jgi:hypothetical protein